MKTVFRWTTAVLFAVALAAGCANSDPVPTSTASSALTFAASRVYAISAANYGQPWCPHGSAATDAASRRNDPTNTVLARLPVAWDPDGNGIADACHPVTASLTLQRQEWSDVATVDVRRILRPVVDPPEGIAAGCAPGGVAAWDTSGVESWTALGARGFGTDASAAAFSFVASADGTKLVTVDLTTYDADGAPISTLVDDCAPTGACVLGLYASAHVWEYPGTFSLFVTCSAGGGGAGGVGGAGGATSTSSTSSSTSSTSTGGGGAGGACQ